MGVTHLENYITFLKEEGAQESVGGEEGTLSLGLGKWSSTLNIGFVYLPPYHTTSMLLCRHCVCPTF